MIPQRKQRTEHGVWAPLTTEKIFLDLKRKKKRIYMVSNVSQYKSSGIIIIY